MSQRLGYEDSCRKLQGDYLEMDEIPPMPDHLPRLDDESPGLSFFRTRLEDDLGNLTLPRTFFGRSEIVKSSFRNTDLTESSLCWNNFIDVDFSDAILAGSDLRAAIFHRVKFVRTDLRRADLRRATFEECSFEGALLEGAVMTLGQKRTLPLSKEQKAVVAWTWRAGKEPEGG
jgi:uncharacterized protein YjbI with pentapeptide repeats